MKLLDYFKTPSEPQSDKYKMVETSYKITKTESGARGKIPRAPLLDIEHLKTYIIPLVADTNEAISAYLFNFVVLT